MSREVDALFRDPGGLLLREEVYVQGGDIFLPHACAARLLTKAQAQAILALDLAGSFAGIRAAYLLAPPLFADYIADKIDRHESEEASALLESLIEDPWR